MTEKEELKELVAQVLEHVRFCRELGVTALEVEEGPGGSGRPERSNPFPTQMAQKTNRPETAESPSRERSREAVDPVPVLLPLPTTTITDQAPERLESLDDIRRDLGDCRRCKLWPTRTNLVFGEGDPHATLMFVGEGPGADEDQSGRPFVGRAGQLLTKMIEAIGLTREQVYIANVVKSRPPGNRTPERDEVTTCLPFLLRQIATIRPKLIVTLGNPATQALLDTTIGISRLRGNFHDYPRLPGIRVMPTYHPAYLLRSPDKKRETWEDLKKVRDQLQKLSS
ncbi:MAG: uracil-DNA glycosylase [Blastocatellia bacterium]|jgi:DNA polymerase